MRVFGELARLGRVPLGALEAVGTALRRLDDLVSIVGSVRDEMIGMRQDVREVSRRVDLLREDVRGLGSGVGGIRTATESLDGKVGGLDDRILALAVSLRRVDALAARFGWLGKRPREVAEEAPEP